MAVVCCVVLACGNSVGIEDDSATVALTPSVSSSSPATTITAPTEAADQIEDSSTTVAPTPGGSNSSPSLTTTTTEPTEAPDQLADIKFDYLVPDGSTAAGVLAELEAADNSAAPATANPTAATTLPTSGGLSDFAGRPLVLNLWASWCPPCVREMPEFESVHQQFKKDVAFLGLNVADQPADALDLAITTGVTYPLASDPEQTIQFDLKILSLPATLLISPTGEELFRWLGPLTETALQNHIADHFADHLDFDLT